MNEKDTSLHKLHVILIITTSSPAPQFESISSPELSLLYGPILIISVIGIKIHRVRMEPLKLSWTTSSSYSYV